MLQRDRPQDDVFRMVVEQRLFTRMWYQDDVFRMVAKQRLFTRMWYETIRKRPGTRESRPRP